jgi:hypothetical protein
LAVVGFFAAEGADGEGSPVVSVEAGKLEEGEAEFFVIGADFGETLGEGGCLIDYDAAVDDPGETAGDGDGEIVLDLMDEGE